jgi:hypothetical protein
MGVHGDQILISAEAMLMHAEGLGNGGAGYISIKNSCIEAAALYFGGHQTGYKGLAYAALTADNTNNLLYGSTFTKGLEKAFSSALRAVCAAAGTIVVAFTHFRLSAFL